MVRREVFIVENERNDMNMEKKNKLLMLSHQANKGVQERGTKSQWRLSSMLWQTERHHQRWGQVQASQLKTARLLRSHFHESREQRRGEHPKFSLQSQYIRIQKCPKITNTKKKTTHLPNLIYEY